MYVCVIFNLELRLKLNYIPINITLHIPIIVSINKIPKSFQLEDIPGFYRVFSADTNAQIAADLKHVEKAHGDLYFFHD